MNNIFKITCPECGEKFDPGSAIDNHIENEAKQKEEKIKKESEKKFKSQIEAKDKEIEKSKKDAEKKAQLEADKKYKSQLALKDKEIEKTRKEEAKKAEALASEKYKSQLSAKDKEIEKSKKDAEKKAQLEADKKYKSQLALKDKEIEKNLKEAELKIKNKAATDYQDKIQKKDDELEKLKKSQEITERRLSQKTEEINKMMKQGSMELQGEVQEERLQDYLEKMFPEDDIIDVSKGKKGGDCIQTINYQDKQNIAKIYFESKDTNTFNEKWANKLLKDMQEKGISNGIIVVSPSCMPVDLDKERSYVERHGNVITIIPMIKPIIHGIVNRIRSILILKSRENKDHEIPALMKKCFEILNSPNFILPIKNMVSDIKNMKDQLEKDKTSYLLSLSKKEKTIDNIEDSLRDMVLPLINLDKNMIPENILIPQEKVKKITKKDVDKIDFKKILNEETEEEDD
jgi:hypothetical protein